jgi:hypothetical protein
MLHVFYVTLLFSFVFTQNLDLLLEDVTHDYTYNLLQIQCEELSIQNINELDLVSLVRREHESWNHEHGKINDKNYLELLWLETAGNVEGLTSGLHSLYQSTNFPTSKKFLEIIYMWLQFFAHDNWPTNVPDLFQKCTSILKYR